MAFTVDYDTTNFIPNGGGGGFDELVIDDLDSIDTVDIGSGLNTENWVVMYNGDEYRCISLSVGESDNYPGRDAVVLTIQK